MSSIAGHDYICIWGGTKLWTRLPRDFFWEDMKSCDTYQRINDTKFSNIGAALLHPIPAEYKGRIAITLLHNVMKVSGVGRESVM